MHNLFPVLVKVLVVFWLACGIASLLVLLITLFRPALWASWIERENDYWVKRGRSSSAFAEKMKKLEKGAAPKIMLVLIAIFSAANVYLLFHLPGPLHFRAAMPPPPNPAPHRPPGH
jgi:hypothetical protein